MEYLYNIGLPWGGIQEYIARDVNILSIEGSIFLYPPKKSHPISL